MENDRRAVLRVEQHEDRRRVAIGRGQFESETGKHDGEGEFGLKKREVLSHAGTRTEAEGDKRKRAECGARHAVGETARIELGGVASPRGLIVMNG